VQAFVDGANQIYEAAGIHIALESVVVLQIPTTQVSSISSSDTDPVLKQKLLNIVFPANNTGDILFQAAFFHNFPSGAKGVYLPAQEVAFIGEFARSGAANEPIVLAHEMGHELSLVHVNVTGASCPDANLMCTGGTGIGTNLTEAQISQMREQALIGPK
jgi:hypothetical protein